MENLQNNVKTVDGEAYIRSCLYVEGANGKTVIRTAERAAFVTLTGENGEIYGEVSNISEPFDFTTHVFYLPREVLSRPMRLSFQNRARKSAYFSAMWEKGEATISPDRVESVDSAALIDAYDNHLSVVRSETGDVAKGISYEILHAENSGGAPVILYALKVAAGAARFCVGTANDGYAPNTEIQTVRGQAEASIRNGKNVVAATNADFFDMFGDNSPAGLCVKDGRSIANGNHMGNFFGMTRNGKPVIGSYRENPELYGQLESAVGGREIFLRGGEVAEFSPGEPFASICHPRTAVGIGKDGRVVVLVVDGRIPVRSNGASLIDLARVMQSFGMETAINLDGGGSSTFIVRENGELVMKNRPADLQRPEEPLIRDIYNSLQIVVNE